MRYIFIICFIILSIGFSEIGVHAGYNMTQASNFTLSGGSGSYNYDGGSLGIGIHHSESIVGNISYRIAYTTYGQRKFMSGTINGGSTVYFADPKVINEFSAVDFDLIFGKNSSGFILGVNYFFASLKNTTAKIDPDFGLNFGYLWKSDNLSVEIKYRTVNQKFTGANGVKLDSFTSNGVEVSLGYEF